MRLKNTRDVLSKKFVKLPLTGVYADVLGQPEANGLWLIYGAEKHGKTTVGLILANYLSTLRKALYVMGEQGIDGDFQDTITLLSIDTRNRRLLYEGYVSIADISASLKKRKSPDIIFIDNMTVYADELKGGALRQLILDHPQKLFIAIAHEKKGEPYTAAAKMAQKLAKRIIRVQGGLAFVSGRCNGGTLVIDEKTAQLYHGANYTSSGGE